MERVKKIFLVKALLMAVLLYFTYNFAPAAIDLGLTYVFIISIAWKNAQSKPASYLFKGFLVAFLSGIFYLFPFSILDGWFTNKDAVHVFAVVSLLFVSSAIGSYEAESMEEVSV
jgi:hypothetical protein